MRALDRLARLGAVALLGAAPACSSGAATGAPADGSAQGETDDADSADSAVGDSGAAEAAPTYAPTFSAIYSEILSPICAGLFCHGGADDFLPMTSKAVAYASMVGVTSHGPDCAQSGLTIVKPGAPDASLMYLKVTTPPCGNKMPAEDEPYLDVKQVGQIREWIVLGALDN